MQQPQVQAAVAVSTLPTVGFEYVPSCIISLKQRLRARARARHQKPQLAVANGVVLTACACPAEWHAVASPAPHFLEYSSRLQACKSPGMGNASEASSIVWGTPFGAVFALHVPLSLDRPRASFSFDGNHVRTCDAALRIPIAWLDNENSGLYALCQAPAENLA